MIDRSFPGQEESGLTLIELLIAMVLGILVAGGIITVFLSTSSSNKAQNQMATLQETGRYAMFRLRDDIGMANALYCSGSGGVPKVKNNGGPSLDQLRSATVYAPDELLGALHDVTTPWDTDGYPPKPTDTFSLPAYLYMRGYDCDKSSCTPVEPSTKAKGIPAPGKKVGDRVIGTSVLTLRYVDSSAGWSLGKPGGSSMVSNKGALQQIKIQPLIGEPAAKGFGADDLAMVADCSAAQVFAVTGQGSSVLTPTTSNTATPGAWAGPAGAKLFDLDGAFRTVRFYLRVVETDNGHTTGALIRRVNGQDQELVRGIERLDFRYGVMEQNGETKFLTAKQVEDQSKAGNCPPSAPAPGGGSASAVTTGCLWRAIKAIEVDLLMDGQTPLYDLSPSDLAYTYGADGINTPQGPESHGIKPDVDQGFPRELLRREFTALIAIRNYNP